MQAQPAQTQPGRQASPRAQYAGQRLLQPITVDDIVAQDVVTVESDTPVRTAVASMAQHDVGTVVVLQDGKPIGVLSDRKVALALEDTPDVAQRTAGDIISGNLVTVDSSQNIFDVVQLMSEEGIRRIPVVDDDGTLQGIVALDDVIVLLGTELGNVAETIQTQIDRL